MEKGDLRKILNQKEKIRGACLSREMAFLHRPDYIDRIEEFLSHLKIDKVEYLANGDDAMVLSVPGENIVVRISTDPKRWQHPAILQSLATFMQNDCSIPMMDNNGQNRNLCIACEILPRGIDDVTEREAGELDRHLLSCGLFWKESKPMNAIRMGGRAYISDQASVRWSQPEGNFMFGQLLRGRNPLRRWTREGQETSARALIGPRYDEIRALGEEFCRMDREREREERNRECAPALETTRARDAEQLRRGAALSVHER